jgi:tetratricopeptide (TPR) repeat protein
MNLASCYQLLALETDASLEDLKSAYRRLARQHHPDAHVADASSAEKFMAITAAYQYLLSQVVDGKLPSLNIPPPPTVTNNPAAAGSASPKIKVQTNSRSSNLSPESIALKQSIYKKLQDFYYHKQHAQAVSLIESLAAQLSEDVEVKKWQAIAYQKMGRQLAAQKKFYQARIYLKKALKEDPHNPKLWADVEMDFRYIERYSGLY